MRAGKSSVGLWLIVAERSGCAALLPVSVEADRRRRAIPLDAIRRARATLQETFSRGGLWRLHKHAAVFDALLQGATRTEAAGIAKVTLPTVSVWIAQAEETKNEHHAGGSLLPGVNGDQLRTLADQQLKWQFAKRLRAMAAIADGADTGRAAVLVSAQEESVRRWLRRFQNDGVEGLRPPPDRKRELKLNADQLQEFRVIVATMSEANYSELRDIVKNRFGVSYTPEGIRRVVLKTLGARSSKRESN